jgi:hypothetical protein
LISQSEEGRQEGTEKGARLKRTTTILSEVRRYHSAVVEEGSTTPEDQEAEAFGVVYSQRCEGRLEGATNAERGHIGQRPYWRLLGNTGG